MQIEGMIMEEV